MAEIHHGWYYVLLFFCFTSGHATSGWPALGILSLNTELGLWYPYSPLYSCVFPWKYLCAVILALCKYIEYQWRVLAWINNCFSGCGMVIFGFCHSFNLNWKVKLSHHQLRLLGTLKYNSYGKKQNTCLILSPYPFKK